MEEKELEEKELEEQDVHCQRAGPGSGQDFDGLT